MRDANLKRRALNQPNQHPLMQRMPDRLLAFQHRLSEEPAVSANEKARLLTDPAFGKVFSEHTVEIRYSGASGWHDASIGPRRGFEMDPAASVFHYGQAIFEGAKAYRTSDERVVLFRPWDNARRFASSAKRLAMPSLPEDLFVESLEQLVRADHEWVPRREGSLYLRPFMIATDAALGAKPSSDYLFSVIASPVGAYFKANATALTVWVSHRYPRVGPGGTGSAKCAGNYAAALVAQAEAASQGCDQVIFLDAVERRWVEELGSMNIFFVFEDGSMLTPALNGNILPGITRASIITLCEARGYSVRQERYSIEQCHADARSGLLVEAFACGTAAVLTAIGKVKTQESSFVIGNGGEGRRSRELRACLLDIQYASAPDLHQWVHPVL